MVDAHTSVEMKSDLTHATVGLDILQMAETVMVTSKTKLKYIKGI